MCSSTLAPAVVLPRLTLKGHTHDEDYMCSSTLAPAVVLPRWTLKRHTHTTRTTCVTLLLWLLWPYPAKVTRISRKK